MKHDQRRETLVGFVAIGLLVFLMVASHSSGDLEDMGDGSYTVKAAFNRVDGIGVGDEVTLGGVPIGTVAAASLGDNFRATLTLRIDEGIALPTDTSAAIHTDSLFGGKFIVLEPGGELDNLQSGDQIVFTQDAQIIGELLDLIIAEGRSVRGLPPAGQAEAEDREAE